MKLNKKQIVKIQQNRNPYLFVDYATKIIPGKYIEGYKILKKTEWFFTGRFWNWWSYCNY